MKPNDETDSNSRLKQFHELKMIIRSIVIPYQDGIKVGTLLRDYKEMEGQEIPYTALGYRSVHHLLQAMPDVVHFKYNKNQDYVLFPIADESTEHIQTMVREQKKASSNSRKSNSRGRFSNSFTRQRSSPHMPQMYRDNTSFPFASPRPPLINNHIPFPMNQSYISLLNPVFANQRQQLPFLWQNPVPLCQSPSAVPLSVQNNIRIMLNEFHCGICLKDFPSFYIHQFKSPLLVENFGFKSLEQCLKSLANICEVDDDGMVLARKKPVLNPLDFIPSPVQIQFGPNVNKVSTRPKIMRTASTTTNPYSQANGFVKEVVNTATVVVTTQQAAVTITSTSVTTTISTIVTRTKPVTSEAHTTNFKNVDWSSWLQAKDDECLAKAQSKSMVSGAGGDLKVTLVNNAAHCDNWDDINNITQKDLRVNQQLSKAALATSAATDNCNNNSSVLKISTQKADFAEESVKSKAPKVASKICTVGKIVHTPTTVTPTINSVTITTPKITTTTCESTNEQRSKSLQCSPSMMITVKHNQSGQASRIVKNNESNVENKSFKVDTNGEHKRKSSIASAIKRFASKSDLSEKKSEKAWPSTPIEPSKSGAMLKPAGSQVSGSEPTLNTNMDIKSRSKVEEWLLKSDNLRRENNILIQKAETSVNSFEPRILVRQHSKDIDNFPAPVIATFKRIIARYPLGVPATVFVQDYEDELGFEMDPLVWGIATPVQVFYSLPSVFVITPPDIVNEVLFPGSEGDHILYDASNVPKEIEELLSNPAAPKRNFPVGGQIPKGGVVEEKVKLRVLKLLQMMSEGILIAEFSCIYRINFREEIYPGKWRYDTFYEFFCALSFELPISVRSGSEPAVSLERKLFCDWLQLCIREQKHSAVQMFVEYPSDAVLPAETQDTIEIPSEYIMKENSEQLSWIPALITSAINPSSFWVHIQGESYSGALDTLMTNLEFYNSAKSEEYRVPDEFLVRGLFCVAKFPVNNDWHRVKIVRLQSSDKATIYYIDYGGLATVDRNELRLLKREFFNLNQQAIHVSLKGIKPSLSTDKANKWSIKARDALLEFSNKHYWLACLFYPKVSPKKYEVIICDTNKDEDIYIDAYLIANNVAVRSSSKENDSTNTSLTINVNPNPVLADQVGKLSLQTKPSVDEASDFVEKDHKKKSLQSNAMRNILETERILRSTVDWDNDDASLYKVHMTNTSSLFSLDTLTGNEEVMSLGRIKFSNNQINLFSIDNEVYVLGPQIDQMMNDILAWKHVVNSCFELEVVVLDEEKANMLHRLNSSLESGDKLMIRSKLYKLKGVISKLNELQRFNEKSQFQNFLQKYAHKYANCVKRRLLLRSFDDLMV